MPSSCLHGLRSPVTSITASDPRRRRAPVGRPSTRGYYLLAYHPLNYVIACTRCNSTLKADYFPVRGRRRTRASTPQSARSEDPLLVYPLGTLDTDPARIIRFDGVLAVPRRKRGRDHERARVTIEFFQLNHQDLTSRRARSPCSSST